MSATNCPALPQAAKPLVEIGKRWDGQHAVHREAGVYSERGIRAEHMSDFELRLQRELLRGFRRSPQ